MKQDNHKFEYTYSAPLQREIKTIQKKYPTTEILSVQGRQKEAPTLEHLRRLDRRVEYSGLVASIGIGLVGAAAMSISMVLAFGYGLTLPSVLIGMTGLILAALALPVHQLVIEYQRKKFAAEILRLAEELTQ